MEYFDTHKSQNLEVWKSQQAYKNTELLDYDTLDDAIKSMMVLVSFLTVFTFRVNNK